MIVLDSSFLIGFYDERDAHHPTAHALIQQFLAQQWGRGRYSSTSFWKS